MELSGSGLSTLSRKYISSGVPPTIFGDGGQERDFIHAKDVTGLVEMLIEKNPQYLLTNCCSGEGISILQIADLMRERFDIKQENVFKDSQEGDIRISKGDPKSMNDFGYTLKMSLQDYIRNMGDHQ